MAAITRVYRVVVEMNQFGLLSLHAVGAIWTERIGL